MGSFGTRFAVLEPIDDSHCDEVYDLEMSGDLPNRSRAAGLILTRSEFFESTRATAVLDVMVRSNDSGTPIGRCTLYGLSTLNQTVHVSVAFVESARRTPAEFEAIIVILNYAFDTLNVRKVYAEVAGFNLSQFEGAAPRLMLEEARLVDKVFAQGRFWDLHIFAIYADTFRQLRTRITRWLPSTLRSDGHL